MMKITENTTLAEFRDDQNSADLIKVFEKLRKDINITQGKTNEEEILLQHFDLAIACLVGGHGNDNGISKKYNKSVPNSTWPSNCGKNYKYDGKVKNARSIPDTVKKYICEKDIENLTIREFADKINNTPQILNGSFDNDSTIIDKWIAVIQNNPADANIEAFLKSNFPTIQTDDKKIQRIKKVLEHIGGDFKNHGPEYFTDSQYTVTDSKKIVNALEYIIKASGNIPVNNMQTESNTETPIETQIERFINSDIKQLILTGAPGTGKTFTARKIALKCVLGDLYENYLGLKGKKIYELIEEYICGDKLIKSKSEKTDEEKKALEKCNAQEYDQIRAFFGEKIDETASSENDEEDECSKKDDGSEIDGYDAEIYRGRIGFVQFHPSYDYTDFVEGLRPVKAGENQIGFDLKDGIFRKFCDAAAGDLDNKYFFIIDEINRADLSKVFGELMFGLEENYRGKPFKTQYSGLRADMGKKSEFVIPTNVYIIGTMNDIDRSVETFDFALRRRFVWIEVKANEVMETVLKNMLKNKDEEIIKDLTDRAINLNNALSDNGKDLNLNEHYHLGPAYFGKINFEGHIEIQAAYQELWNNRIEPILREYVRGYEQVQIKAFIDSCKAVFFKEQSKDTNMNAENN